MGMRWLGHTASEDKLQRSFLCKALKQCKPKAAGAASHLLCHPVFEISHRSDCDQQMVSIGGREVMVLGYET